MAPIATKRKSAKMLVMTSGMVVVDRIAVDLPEAPEPGKTQFTKRPIEEHVGGHPHNVPVDLARLGVDPTKLGMIAAVGKDSGGTLIEKTFTEYGIQSFLKKVSTPTGQDLILVPKGRDRIFSIGPGANLDLDAGYVKKILAKYKPKVLSIRPGYSGIDLEMSSILEDLEDTFILLDLMKPFDKEWDFIMPAVPYADAVHCNEMEAMNVTGSETVERAVEVFLNSGVKLVLITSGHEGAHLETKSMTISQPTFSIEAIDPTGAGDAFCAGIIYKMIEWGNYRDLDKLPQDKLVEMLMFAQAAGASAAAGVGCTEGVSKDKVEALLKEQKEEIVRKTKVRRS